MLSARRLALLAVVGGLAAVFSAPADARPMPASYPELVTTPHFAVHFMGDVDDPIDPDATTYQVAGDLAAHAERAYATLVNDWGYPAPLNDGDGLVDIWIFDFGDDKILGAATPDAPGNTATGWIAINVSAATAPAVIAHEVLHVIQFAQWIPADSWLLEGTAEWAGFIASGYQPFGGSIEATRNFPDMSLDCDSPACGPDGYEAYGYSRWTFFEYMSDRFGVGFVKDILGQAAALADPLQTGTTLLNATLAAKGTTLSDVYADYVNVNLVGGYDVPGLAGRPPITERTVSTGVTTGALPVQKVPVNHLAARYLKLQRGASAAAVCHAATLSLTVGLPAGINAKPSFFSRSLGAVAVPLSVNGNTATLAVPWDTCFGGYDGYLSLPNPSLNADGRDFVVSGSLSVDTTRLATPAGTCGTALDRPHGRRPVRRGGAVDPRLRRADRARADRDPRRTPDRLLERPRQAPGGTRQLAPADIRASRRQQRRALQASGLGRQGSAKDRVGPRGIRPPPHELLHRRRQGRDRHPQAHRHPSHAPLGAR